ncbi:MAG: SnoaL-like domain-containing protein [Acaryochloridaceae cyanobacterium RU_4_10]|nr:SnoaL-like domain-containing protein [Acaryochloridaceae cyanobacterium RU_4_10]
MSNIQQIIDRYLAAWNTLDPEQRSTAMQAIVADNCYYADAHLPDALTSREAHDRFITQFRTKFPDFSLQLDSPTQGHHGYYRFGWQLLKVDGSVFTKGMYFGEINDEGKICKIIGFID